ncbi:MAG: ABC transporter substrate-binding protein [Myxococcales bacterium]|nr:MAG: ABC transporter substrate-binding protein [Myxococcales bacterium]
MTMRRSFARTLVLAGVAIFAIAASASAPGPRDVVAKTVDDVLAVLKDASLTPEARRDAIVEIAYQRFDFPTMSKLVLAKYWKRFDPAQREAFQKEFKDFLAHRYGDRIDRYEQEKVEIVGERSAKGGDAIVQTRIHRPRAESVLVDYRLRSSGGAWRVIDVKIEGISLVSNYRDQFHEVLSQGGPEKLLTQLRERNAGRGGEKS